MNHDNPNSQDGHKPTSSFCQNRNKFVLHLPPSLRNFSMHSNSVQYTVSNLSFDTANNLESVDLSGNTFHKLTGQVNGLYKLKHLDLSSSFIDTIGGGFFEKLRSLEYLNLYQNLLGNQIFYNVNESMFSNLHTLKYLNLSFNNLFILSSPVLKELNNLEVLDLSINRLSHATFSIGHMKKLKFLDLHKNDFRTLPSKMRNDISSLLKNNVSVTVDMRQNPITCQCSNLPFLEWVLETKVFGENHTLYYCEVGSLEFEVVDGYKEVVNKLRIECADNVVLLISVIIMTILLLSVMIGFLIHRFRWTLRYWYHAAKLKVTSDSSTNTEEFEYDAFISYSTDDVDFVMQELHQELSSKRQLRLLIHDETFQAGRHITDNIYTAVSQSRKTLVVVTRSMLKSHWCTYELQMARMESIGTGRDVLIFLFFEDDLASEMSTDVVTYIKTSTYVSYPDRPGQRKQFWDKLANDIKD